MHFQHLCNTYLRELQVTRDNTLATDELSLHGCLKAFLEQSADYFGHTLTLTHEPRQLEVGRPDFIAMDGLLPIGYIEAEKFGTDLNALTGHAREQNTRFIENLDNFILTNFVDFRLYTEGQLRASASLSMENGRARLPEEVHALGNPPQPLFRGRRAEQSPHPKSSPCTSHAARANFKSRSQPLSPTKKIPSSACLKRFRNISSPR